MESRKILRLVTSLLISIALWVYVINVVNPSSTTVVRNIPVTLTGTEALYEKNLAIDGSGKYTVDITVRGSRTDLATISADNISATADVSELTLGQDYITVEVKVPKDYTVEDIRSRKQQVYVDELQLKTVDVNVVYTGNQSQGSESAVISVYPSVVEVSGAKNQVEKVSSYDVTVDSAALKYEEITELLLEGQVKDSSGNVLAGVTASDSNVTVKAAVYPTKTVTLHTVWSGQPWAGARINRITAPETVTVKGASADLAGVSEVYSEEIDIDGISGDTSIGIVPILPEGVYLSEKDKGIKLVADLDDTGSIDFHYYPYEITTNNLSDKLYATYSLPEDQYITATVKGPIATLKTMSSSDVTLTADGSKFVLGTANVKVTATTQISGVNISLSPDTVSVYVREK